MDAADHGAASTAQVILTPKQQLGGQSRSTKAPATLGEYDTDPSQILQAHESDDEVPSCGWSAVGMWAMFVLGFVLVPCWWVGVAVGLKSGSDNQFLLRRKKLPRAQNTAWWGCVAMSVISTLLLILVLSILFAKKAPAQEGPFYITLSGPLDAFPDLNDPANRAVIASAVRSALNLGDNYPLSNIMVWVSSQHDLALPTGRRLSNAASQQMIVLAYTLVRTDKLPQLDQLEELLASPSTTATAARDLAHHNFVADEHAGRLSLVLAAQSQQVDQVISVLQGTEATEDMTSVQQFMHPIGMATQASAGVATQPSGSMATQPSGGMTTPNMPSDCQGAWTAWGPCNVTCGQGFTSRTYNITMPSLHGGQACPAAHNDVEENPCTRVGPGYDPTDCTKCIPGYAGPACTICPVGRWSAGGPAPSTTCTSCVNDTTTLSTGTTSDAGCICSAGFQTIILTVSGPPTCQPCPLGFYANASTAANGGSCSACSSGFTTPDVSSTSAGDCTVCAPGHAGNTCTECAVGTYSPGGDRLDVAEAAACRTCQTGTTTASAGASSCTAITPCPSNPGSIPQAASQWNCTGNTAGSSCTATCPGGGTPYQATCVASGLVSQWSQATGGPCNQVQCPASPGPVPSGAAAWECSCSTPGCWCRANCIMLMGTPYYFSCTQAGTWILDAMLTGGAPGQC